jgi:branched-subunit amino acid transport protein AzlD
MKKVMENLIVLGLVSFCFFVILFSYISHGITKVMAFIFVTRRGVNLKRLDARVSPRKGTRYRIR